MLRSWARATETTRLSGPVSEAILHFAFVSAPQRHHGIQTRVTPFGQIRPTVTWTGWPLAERMATIIEEAIRARARRPARGARGCDHRMA